MDALSRRQFISVGGGAVIGAGLGAGYVALGRPAQAAPMLRPPGALAEQDFLAACIRCGQCVEACPIDVLHLTDLSTGTAAATPYFVAVEKPCNLCQGFEKPRCIEACPTAALSPIALDQIDIGKARLHKGRCLAYNGTVCRTCWHVCPFPDQAITFDELLRPVVKADHCIGCGLCEHACPTDRKSITVTPRETLARSAAARGEAQSPESHGGDGQGRGQGGAGRGLGRGRQEPGARAEP